MLLDLREKVRSSKPIKYTLITIICIPFVFFGVSSYFGASSESFAAKIDGEEISARQLEAATNQQRARLAQMFGGSIPEGFSNEAQLRQQALDSLLSQQALRNEVADARFAVSNETLAKTIQEIPMFQRDGQFDPELYRAELRSGGRSTAEFEASFRDDTALAQFRSGVVDTAFILPTEKQRLDDLTNQVRKVDYLQFSMEDTKAEIEVTDEEVSTYFSENADDYQFPQRVKIEYIELSRDQLASGMDVTDEDVSAYYDGNKGNYLAPEERKASHILLEVDGDLDNKTTQLLEIKKRVEDGEDFADLAKEFSTDVGSAEQGGSLGQFGRGAMVPEFDEAVFAMTEPGTLSEPLKTEFGLHLIRLDEAIPERGKSLEEVKSSIVSTLQRQRADVEYLDLVDILTEQTFDSSDSLEPAATSMGMDVKTSDWIDGTAQVGPVLGNPDVLRAALSEDVLTDGNNSEVISIGERYVVVLRVLEHEGPRPKTLDDVKEELTEKLKTDKAAAKLDEAVAAAQASIEAGDELAAIAEDNAATLTEGEEFRRTSTSLDRNVVSQLFELPKPGADKPLVESSTVGTGDRVLLVLREIYVAPPEESSSETDTTETSEEAPAPEAPPVTFADPQSGNSEFTLLVQSLRAAADVEVNEQVLSGEAAVGY